MWKYVFLVFLSNNSGNVDMWKYVYNGCGHTWDLTLVKGFYRGKKDVKKLYYSKTHYLT